MLREIIDEFGLGENRKLFVTHHPADINNTSVRSIYDMDEFIPHPDFGIFGDMWLLSFSDVLVYNPTSTASRTAFMWNLLNNPSARVWPPENYYKDRKKEEVFCKKFYGWRKML